MNRLLAGVLAGVLVAVLVGAGAQAASGPSIKAVTQTTSLPSDTQNIYTATVTCPLGYRVVSGGYDAPSPPFATGSTSSRPAD